MGLEYTAVPDVEDQDAAPARSASTVSRVTVVGAVVCGLALGSLAAYGGVFRSGAAPAAFAAVHTPTAVDGGMGTIGAMNVAVYTSATADATSDCWENYGGICMYKESSCSSYGGTKNSSGCGSGKCFCCQSIDSSLIGDDDAVLAYVDTFIGDDDKRSRSKRSSKGADSKDDDEGAISPDDEGAVDDVDGKAEVDDDGGAKSRKAHSGAASSKSPRGSKADDATDEDDDNRIDDDEVSPPGNHDDNDDNDAPNDKDEDDTLGDTDPDDEGFVDDIDGKGPTNDDGGDPEDVKTGTKKSTKHSSKKTRSASDDDADDASTSTGPAPKTPPSGGSDNGDTHKKSTHKDSTGSK